MGKALPYAAPFIPILSCGATGIALYCIKALLWTGVEEVSR